MPQLPHPYLSGPYPRAFAHRGWHLGDLSGMENSLAAFRRAVAEGYRYLETDVQVTRDGVVAVLHDATLDRTTDASGPVEQLTWAQVRTARVGGQDPICRLADLLEDLPQALVNVDVKTDAAVEPVLHLLHHTNTWHRVCLASFSEARLQRLRRAAGPRLLTSMGTRSAAALRLRSIVSFRRRSMVADPPPPRLWIRGELAQLPVRSHGITVVDRALTRYAHHLGLEVHVWTVDRAETMTALLDLGVDGLVSDRPDVLRQVLRDRGEWPAEDLPSP